MVFSCWRNPTTPSPFGMGDKSLTFAPAGAIAGERPLCPCKRCRAGMDDYTAVVADAAQFCEEVSQDEIVKAPNWSTDAQGMWSRFSPRNAQAASPLHTTTPTPGPLTFGHTQQIELALLLALSQSYFSVSGETWRQRRVPIGDLVSKILCSVVMGASETQWSEDWQRRGSLGFGGKMMLQTSATWVTPPH